MARRSEQQRVKSRFRPLHDLIPAYIDCAIRLTGGNLTEAAELLGVGRATLYRRRAGRIVNARNPPFPRDGNVSLREPGRLSKRLAELRSSVKEATANPGDAYELGVANGMLLARHIMEGRRGDPAYL